MRAAWRCFRRIASDAFRVEVGAAARVAADLGNTALGALLVSGGGGGNKTGTYLFHHLRSFADASCSSGVVSASKKSTMNS